MKGNPSRVVLEWIKRANSDLGFAEAAFKEFDDFYSQMCVLCHDAVEKYLKAYLVFKKKRYKRIHDLAALLKDCSEISGNFDGFLDFEDGCKVLNNYYAPLKYPSHFPSATQKQAKEAIGIAKEIGTFIKEEIL